MTASFNVIPAISSRDIEQCHYDVTVSRTSWRHDTRHDTRHDDGFIVFEILDP